MLSSSRAVVFDLGAVLVDWDREHLYRELIPDPRRRAYFLDQVCPLSWNLEQDRGRPFSEGLAEREALHPEWRREIRAYWERWDEMVVGAVPGMPDVVEELAAQGVPLYALTNFSAETYPRMPRRFPFFRHFRGVVVSGEEGVVKPDPEIYRRLESRFGLPPESLFFIDDVPANVETARNRGWGVHLFRGVEPLRRSLVAEGLLPA